jgi:uncharacterized protein (TIGR02246 family)
MLMLLRWVAVVTMVGSLPAQSPAGTGADEAAVREIVKKYMDARELQDASSIETLFTIDADQLVSSGEWRKGRPDVVKGTLTSSRRSAGKRSITLTSVRFLAPGVALADGRYELAGLSGGETRRMWTSLILTRGSDGWRIAAIRNMLPAAPAATR